MNDEDPTEVRPDGTPVYGPSLAPQAKKRDVALFGVVAAACAFFLLLGVFVGTQVAPQPSWQELYGERILEACLPQVSVVGVGTVLEVDRLNDALDTMSQMVGNLADEHDLEKHLVEVELTDRLNKQNPRAQYVAYVTFERCL